MFPIFTVSNLNRTQVPFSMVSFFFSFSVISTELRLFNGQVRDSTEGGVFFAELMVQSMSHHHPWPPMIENNFVW